MLQSIRDRSQGLIVGVIVFLISLTFALFGVQEYINAGARVIVAEVEGEEIELREFQDSLQRVRRQAQSILGAEFDPNDWNTERVRERTLDEVINDRLVSSLANDARIRISDAQVAAQIQRMPSFQENETFSRRLYEERIPLLGYSQLQFEEEMRTNLQKAQIRAGLAASEFVTREEAERVQQFRKQKRDIGYAVIPASEFEDEVSVTDEDVVAWFDEHREEYRAEERASVAWLEISPAALAEEVIVTEEALKSYYENNQAAYTAEEERNVNHVLVQLAQSASEEEEAEALAKIASVIERAGAGEAFEELAKELSDDVGSRTEGGETGFFPRGVMAPEFEEAAFALEVDQISEPVRTRFGFHLIKLRAIKPGGLRPFEDVRDDVETAYRAEESQKLFFDQAEQFSNLVYEHPDGLDVAAEALGLEVRKTGLLERTELAERFSERLATAAFDAEVLLEGLNSEPVELDDGRVVAVRVLEHEPSAIPELDAVRDEVEAAVRDDRLRSRTEAEGQTIIAALRDGATVADVVGERGFGWERVDGADRESTEVNRAVLRAAFRTEVPDSGPVFTGLPIGRSDYAVIRMANPATPPASELDTDEVAEVKQELVESRAGVVWQEFLRSLRASADVKTYPDRL